jgi:hypothetical protein
VDLLPVWRAGWHLPWFPPVPCWTIPSVRLCRCRCRAALAVRCPLITIQGVQATPTSLAPWHADPTGLLRTSLEKLRDYAASVPAFWVSLALMRPGYDGLDGGSRGRPRVTSCGRHAPTLSAAITARPPLQRHGEEEEERQSKAGVWTYPAALGKASRPF